MDEIDVPHEVHAEEVLEHRMLEEDLNLQLSMLKDEMPVERLFPEQHQEPMLDVPDHSVEDAVKEPWNPLKMIMMEESVDEAIMLCGAVALLALAPAILHG